MGDHTYKGVGVHFADFISSFLKLVGLHLSVFFFIIMNPNFSSEIIPVLYICSLSKMHFR